MRLRFIKLFLRAALAAAFLSAVADRFGLYPPSISSWGNWPTFLDYTQLINPWAPESLIPALGFLATAAELIFGVCLLIGFKTKLFARLSGYLLLVFGLAMVFSVGIKKTFDYSVFTASAAAFALSILKDTFLEVDSIFSKKD